MRYNGNIKILRRGEFNKDIFMGMRRFHFERLEDASGVSGCGNVAEGCLFTDTGQAVVHWLGSHGSVNLYNCLEDVIFVHGHEGRTKIVFDDPQNSYESKKDEVKKDGN
jgi:hypothetical protein